MKSKPLARHENNARNSALMKAEPLDFEVRYLFPSDWMVAERSLHEQTIVSSTHLQPRSSKAEESDGETRESDIVRPCQRRPKNRER